MFDELEWRLLLASITLNQGVLKVVGSKKFDSIIVTFSPATRKVAAGGTFAGAPMEREFSLKKVKRTEILALGGNDTVSVSGNARPVFADLGPGHDFGNFFGPGKATVLGGKGSDVIMGSNAGEMFDGGDGLDSIRGGGGNDTIIGGGTFDQLFGEAGDDIIGARDRVLDAVDGGTGTDRATIDFNGATPLDAVQNVETVR